ncbi:MAG: ribonuclease Z [Candidatus Parvarchaeota archaeon]|nr:ribonuclease Z [Candidatus Jingweiarchaeum tengchongense]
MIEIVFLGTSSMFPTEKRNHPSVLLRYEGDYMLFDCGEGTQRQLRIAKISPMKINRVFITHWHGDHALGLGGIIQSLSASGREKALEIYGPKGTKKYVSNIMNSFSFVKNFDIEVHEILPGKKICKVLEAEKYEIFSCATKHNIPTVAFSFCEKERRKINLDYVKKYGLVKHPILGRLQNGETITWKGHKITPAKGTVLVKGKKVTYIADTSYDRILEEISKESDLLICEASFANEHKELAEEYAHLTAETAANIAKNAKAKELILFHFSQRYGDDLEHLHNEAKKVFPNTKLANDFMRIILN